MDSKITIWEPRSSLWKAWHALISRAWENKKIMNWCYSKKLSQNLKAVSHLFSFFFPFPNRERNTRLMFDPQHTLPPAEKPCRGAQESYSCLLLFFATGLGKRGDFHIPFWPLSRAGKDYDFRDFWSGAGSAVLPLPSTDCQKELQATTLILDSIPRAG